MEPAAESDISVALATNYARIEPRSINVNFNALRSGAARAGAGSCGRTVQQRLQRFDPARIARDEFCDLHSRASRLITVRIARAIDSCDFLSAFCSSRLGIEPSGRGPTSR